jgi:hypothetical protein
MHRTYVNELTVMLGGVEVLAPLGDWFTFSGVAGLPCSPRRSPHFVDIFLSVPLHIRIVTINTICLVKPCCGPRAQRLFPLIDAL